MPNFTVDEVKIGLPRTKVLIRGEKIDEKGQKIVLSREASLAKINDAVGVVEGANLIHNEYGNRLFEFLFLYHWFPRFSRILWSCHQHYHL